MKKQANSHSQRKPVKSGPGPTAVAEKKASKRMKRDVARGKAVLKGKV